MCSECWHVCRRSRAEDSRPAVRNAGVKCSAQCCSAKWPRRVLCWSLFLPCTDYLMFAAAHLVFITFFLPKRVSWVCPWGLQGSQRGGPRAPKGSKWDPQKCQRGPQGPQLTPKGLQRVPKSVQQWVHGRTKLGLSGGELVESSLSTTTKKVNDVLEIWRSRPYTVLDL